jgi:hypothetical protein
MNVTGSGPRASARKDPRIAILNFLIGALALLVVFLGASFVSRTFFRPPVDAARAGGSAVGNIQLDVLNGCGASGAGTAFTAFLRARGFDVVEIRNYKSFDLQESLVIDRTGNVANAERVAYALGIGKKNIIQQINQDYFVDVSVVIGRDYTSLKPSQ